MGVNLSRTYTKFLNQAITRSCSVASGFETAELNRVFYLAFLQFVLPLGNLGVGHGISPETPFSGLNANIRQRLMRCAAQVAVAIGGHSDHRAFAYFKNFVVYLEFSFSRKNYVIFVILLVFS